MKTGRTFWDFLTEVFTDPLAVVCAVIAVMIVKNGIVEVMK